MRRWALGLIGVMCLTALGASQTKTQKIEIKTDGPLEINSEKRTAHASRNVRLTTQDGTIAADEMEFTFDEEFAIVSLTATGHVHISLKTITKDKVERHIDARGETATYHRKDRLFVLKGENVTGKIVEPARQRTMDLTCKVASIWLDENRVLLEGGTVIFTQPEKAPEPAPAKP